MADTDYTRANRAAWQDHASDYVQAAVVGYASDPAWGIWGIPNTRTPLLPDDLTGVDCLEIGCGAGYVSAWMARRGGKVIGIDPTPNQLATARRLRNEHGLNFALVEAYGERLPFPDSCFDFAISEYGSALWSDPYVWIPEAARVLRPGGRLTFLTNSIWWAVSAYEDDTPGISRELLRPYLGMHRFQFLDAPDETEFHLPHGEMIALLNGSGFRVEQLLELGAPANATSRYPWADVEWAQCWPTEEVWIAIRSDPG